ncbi:MAG: hypothetical protein LBC76_11060 [Treponema sp.]|nr:hypothetical protein [Treponema sp.]
MENLSAVLSSIAVATNKAVNKAVKIKVYIPVKKSNLFLISRFSSKYSTKHNGADRRLSPRTYNIPAIRMYLLFPLIHPIRLKIKDKKALTVTKKIPIKNKTSALSRELKIFFTPVINSARLKSSVVLTMNTQKIMTPTTKRAPITAEAKINLFCFFSIFFSLK